MDPTSPHKGISIGYSKGLLGKECTPEIDFIKEDFTSYVSKSIFFESYQEGFRKGRSFSSEITSLLEGELGLLTQENIAVLSDYLTYSFERYWGRQIILKWEDRTKIALALQSKTSSPSAERILDLITLNKIQQAIQMVIELFLEMKLQDLYFKALLKDLTFKTTRDKRKKKDISLEEYQDIKADLTDAIQVMLST